MTRVARDLPGQQPDLGGMPARTRVAVVFAAGLSAGLLTAFLIRWQLAPLLGWDVAALSYVIWEWTAIWPLGARDTARQALREDPSRPTADVLLLAASVTSLLAVGIVIVTASSGSKSASPLQVALCVASVVCSWAVVHTVFTLRYARLYYTGPDGGVEFHQADPPRYSDFAYLAFTIGMTFQVSDTNLTSSRFRATALRHALLSYMLGAVILATTINLVAGLLK
jgi:uncharacterized membrane protein